MADIPIYKLTQLESVIDATLIAAEPFVTGYTFGGTVTPTSMPLTEAVNAFYYAPLPGSYINLGNILLTEPSFIYYQVGTGYSSEPLSFSGLGVTGVISVNNDTGPAVMLTTDDIPEGATNKYFTGTIPTDINQLADSSNLIGSKAPLSNVLTLDNTTPYTPTLNYHPVTKVFVETAINDAINGDTPITNVATANLAYEVDWNTATLPPIPQDTDLTLHLADTTIHFTQADIDKYTQSEVDALVADLDSRLDTIETWIESPGTTEGVTKALFFSHIYNLSVHFTMEDMYDYVVNNIGDIDSAILLGAVGDRVYSQENYILSGQTVTASLDALDIELYEHISDTTIHFTEASLNILCAGGVRT